MSSVSSSSSSSTEADTVALDGSQTGQRSGDATAGSAHDEIPARIGRYLVEARVGAGGMGVVYSAHDPELDRPVAIKVLNPDKTKGSWGSEGAARLLREAQAMAQLSHPNVIEVFDFGRIGDGVFITMELVDGTTLRRWLDETRSTAEILAVFASAGRGLEAAHAAGLVHRDFKPDNVLVGNDGRIHVADFGLARPTTFESPSSSAHAAGRPLSSSSLGISDESLTAVGAVMGTPTYMSPEQHRGAAADARSDQYSFCIALFIALFGASPFGTREVQRLARLKATADITWPTPPRPIPRHVTRALRRGLRPDPADRWASMSELLAAIDGDGGGRRPRWLALAAVGGLGIASLSMAGDAPATEDATCDRQARIWIPQQRTTVAQTLARGTTANADDLGAHTLAALDDYDDKWSRHWAEACDIDQVEAVQACLSDQRRRFDAIVERLVELDPEQLQQATRIVSWLEPVEHCAAGAIRTGRPQPPIAIAEAVDAVRAELDTATSYEAAGRPSEGLEIMDRVVERARQLDFVPLLAEALYRQGRFRRHLSDGEGALACFTEAVHLAEAHRYDTVVANASIEAMTTLGLTLDRTDEALAWARRAEAAVERIGTGMLEDARLRHHEGIVHARAGNYQRAYELMKESLAMRRRIQGDDHADVAANLLDLGAVLGDMARHEEAYATGLQALATWERAAGPGHQYSAFARMNIGSELMALRRFDEAQSYLEQAHETLVDVLGADHPMTLSAYNNLATLHQQAGRLDTALPIAEDVLARRVERFGPDHREVGRAHGNVAVILLALERADEARPHAEAAARILEMAVGAKHPDLMTPTKILADILDRQGKSDEALPLRDRAVELARTAYGDDNYEVGRMLASRAATRLELGTPADAIEDARAAIDNFAGKPRHAQREGEAGFVLAKALAAADRRDDARRAALAARERLAAATDSEESADLLTELDAWMDEHV